MSSNNSLKISLGLIFGLLGFGTLGLKIIMKLPWFDCFYFTLITITTIGYGELPGMTRAAQVFTVFLIVLGVGSIGYALSSAAKAVVESELVSTFGKRRMFKDISKLEGHYIVCGAGRIGLRVIREIDRRGQEFVVIESDESIAERLLALGYLVLMGDATNEDVLRGAGIDRAKGLVAAVSSDPDNLYITLTARDINKELMIVCRANDESAVKRLQKAGANRVVSPAITGSNQMAQMLLRPAVADFLELASMTEKMELEMEQTEIHEGSPFIGTALKDTTIRAELNVIIIGIKRADSSMIFNPSADTIIEARDSLVAIGSHANLERLEKMANPAKQAITSQPKHV